MEFPMSLSTLVCAVVIGQLACPGGRCPNPPHPVTWHTQPDEPTRAYLYVNGRQAGGYDGERDVWRPFDADTGSWGPAQALFPNRRGGAIQADVPNFGIMRDRLAGEERYSLSGVPVNAAKAREAFSALTDDSQLLR